MNVVQVEQITYSDLIDVIKEVVDVAIKQNENKEDVQFITIQEASKRLHVSIPTIYDYSAKGYFSLYKIGKRTLIKLSELIKAVEKIN